MKLTSESKFLLSILTGAIVIVAGALWIFSKPTKPLAKELLVPAASHMLGNPDAKTYLVEFSDFQCPACAAFEPAIEAIINKESDKLLFVYRHFPLPKHENALAAAKASEAAGKQGKFWEMHHLLFTNQANLSPDLYGQLAEQLNLDIPRFTEAMSASEVASSVSNDVDLGRNIGINATPTFFLNGVKINPVSPQDLASMVQTAIQQ